MLSIHSLCYAMGFVDVGTWQLSGAKLDFFHGTWQKVKQKHCLTGGTDPLLSLTCLSPEVGVFPESPCQIFTSKVLHIFRLENTNQDTNDQGLTKPYLLLIISTQC